MNDTSTIRLLTVEDIPRILTIAHHAGWTQTEADLERMIRYAPEGSFGLDTNASPPDADSAERILASTALAFRHGPELGWIAMVLTDPAHRGHGFASRLMEHAISYLRARGTAWIKLDASEFGQPIYERMGFVPENLMERRLRPPGNCASALHDEALPEVVESDELPLTLDRKAFGADRSRLLGMLAGLHGARTAVLPMGRGYAILRFGKRGRQLGPMVCTDAPAAEALVRWAIGQSGDNTLQWDLIRENEPARMLADHYGFETHRVLTRMTLKGTVIKDTSLVEHPTEQFGGSNDLVYSIAGFDFG